ncbi:MAG: hypothetical protein K9L22_00805 [Methylococcaceae bacterium]|nr:hypothetical protein [Methylococcaceae bacterium]
MAQSKKILVVEGETDKSFFKALCKKLDLNTIVRIAPPKELAPDEYNSKQGVFNYLKGILPQLDDGEFTNIAIIVDADYIKFGQGKSKTLETVCKLLTPFGFELKPNDTNQNGFVFIHSDGLNDFGLWIMSNNSAEGMLEDWVISCIKEDEAQLFQQAKTTIQQLLPQKFQPHHQAKAEVATWLAWQKKPDYGIYTVFNDELLDENSSSFTELNDWLNTIFLAN